MERVKLRKDYLWNKYCANKSLSPDQFIEKVKAIYYQYDAPLYNPKYEISLYDFYKKLFEWQVPGKDIVDIGAGTGISLKIVKKLYNNYNKYYFLEPFKAMSDRCDMLDDSVIIINGYIQDLDGILPRDSKTPRIFIISGVLRTVSDMPDFLSTLKKLLRPGDVLFFPIEPNNNYFEAESIFQYPYKIKIKLTQFVEGVKKKFSTLPTRIGGVCGGGYLDFVLRDLRQGGFVNNAFHVDLIMAVVYYNNFLYWRNEWRKNLGCWDERFFNVQDVADTLDCDLTISSSDHFYGMEYFGSSALKKFTERILEYLNIDGATLSCTMVKR